MSRETYVAEVARSWVAFELCLSSGQARTACHTQAASHTLS